MNKSRKITLISLLAIVILCVAATFPLNNAFLQTDLNGNQKKITNLLELDVTTLNAANLNIQNTNVGLNITNLPLVTLNNPWDRFPFANTNSGSNAAIRYDSLLSQFIQSTSNFLSLGVSLKSFGAVGDGITDDTTACQNWANFICSNPLHTIGVVPPGTVGYLLSSPVGFSNTCRVIALGGGSVYAAGDFPLTTCRFIQSIRGANCLNFTNYADSINVEGIMVTNTAPNNFTNMDSCGMKFDGAVGAHACRVVQCGAANFGRGFFSIDLAASTFISDCAQFNAIGIEITNKLSNGNYPMKADSCVFSHNYTNNVLCSSSTLAVTLENCIITVTANPCVNLMSFSPAATLLNCSFGGGGDAAPINQSGGSLTVVGGHIVGSVLAFPGRYHIRATNADVVVNGRLMETNSDNNVSVYLSGNCKFQAFPPTGIIYNDGSNITTNLNTSSLGSRTIISQTNSVIPNPVPGAIVQWYSNYDGWIITPFKTNRVFQGQ